MFEKVLIIDNDTDSRDRFYEVLSGMGYKAMCVPTAKEAMHCLSEERPDLLVIAETLSDRSGVEAALEIRKFDKDIGIVLLSDKEVTPDIEGTAKKLNIQGVVKKDFTSHHMMKKILEVIRLREPGKFEAVSGTKTKGSVMVVDDNAEIRMVLWTFLNKKGYAVTQASSGEEALMALKMNLDKPEAVLLDIRMPGMDGLMVLKKICNLYPKIKVIMLTSSQEEFIMEEAKRAGAVDYLIKPCNFQQLDALLQSLLLRK